MKERGVVSSGQPPVLPPAREPGRYAIALVCLGNICRSPMAEVVLTARVHEAGLAHRVEVASSGTGHWHVGQPMDERAAATLTSSGYDASRHRARQFDAGWLEAHDLVLGMDAQNVSDIRTLAPDGHPDLDQRVRLFRSFDPAQPGGEVPDPYYGGDDGFEEVLRMVERAAQSLVARLRADAPWDQAQP